jgi:MoaA/NifB/PqqE/SkfB family radical SAM enzyme
MAVADTREIGISLEVVECSNRCRHCETSYGPRTRHLSRDEVRTWADEIRRQADRIGVKVNIGLNNSEPLDHPEWREILADLGHDRFFSGFPTNGRQIARNPHLIDELKDRGVEWLQLTLGGGSPETHDAFTRRPGSLRDIITTANLAYASGLHVCWGFIAYRPLSEIALMSDLAKSISLPFSAGRYDHKGGIDQTIYLIKPQGEGKTMEHLRPTRTDLAELPDWAGDESFSLWFGAGCETEGELVNALCTTERRIGCLEQGHPECGGMGLVACRNGDIYPGCHEREPAYLLGNLYKIGLAGIIDRLFANPPPALAIRRRGLPELAASYGDPNGEKLHSGCSLCRTLVNRAIAEEQTGDTNV